MAPPFEVLVEFLHALRQFVNPYDQITPVLRGSMLMRHWFGEAARPAADIDLEWFAQRDWRAGRGASPLEHARILCMYAVSEHNEEPISFADGDDVPNDGVNLNLWEYDTPGQRCYTGWTWNERGLRGILQIDLALTGSYDLASVATDTIELPRARGEPVSFLAYAPEMLLAAKLSWILRHLQPQGRGVERLTFTGDAKDLFDAHLLLTKGALRAERFADAFFGVARTDKINWKQVDLLADTAALDEKSVEGGPAEMLTTVARRVSPLFDEVRKHLPFLRSIQADVSDEEDYQIYADWLEERGDSRASFLRLFCRYFFQEERSIRGALATSLSHQPRGWLYELLDGPERAQAVCRRIESP